jgi:hypothetical protein
MRKLTCIALLAVAVLFAAGDQGASVGTISTPTDVAQDATSPVQAGLVVELDPVTGQPTEPSAETFRQLQGERGSSLAFSDEGLVEESSVVIGGGYKVDLQGRFQHTMTVTFDPDGETRSNCTSAPKEGVK